MIIWGCQANLGFPNDGESKGTANAKQSGYLVFCRGNGPSLKVSCKEDYIQFLGDSREYPVNA